MAAGDPGIRDLSRRLSSMVVFRSLLRDPAVHELENALRCCAAGRTEPFLRHISAFSAYLLRHGGNWSRYLFRLTMEDENPVICNCGNGPLETPLLAALEQELQFLQFLSQMRLTDLPDASEYLTGWNVTELDLPGEYRRRMEQVGVMGYGIFARYHVFTLREIPDTGKMPESDDEPAASALLQPVRHPDPQTLDELPGYEREREKIIANTEALLHGQPAGNVLLYGDAGTGKSSTVKAIANAYADRGLRLIEIKKNQLYRLPGLVDALAENPLKFLLFIDDLSFMGNDDDFAALKAILEGSAGGRAQNAVVYATSNRRHLIKETMSDRAGDDIHASDTRQELMSLAARFGLTVTFSVPDRDKFLYIVRELAKQHGLTMSEQELSVRAEAFALRAGGRSARAARQFVELCAAGVLNPAGEW